MASSTLGFIPIARPTFDVAFAETATQQARNLLQQAGLNVLGSDQLVMSMDDAAAAAQQFAETPIDFLLIFQASFADTTMVMRIVDMLDAPLLMWAIPEAHTGGRLRLNSLCGINLAGHALTRAGFVYEYVYAPPDSETALDKVVSFGRAARVKQGLRETRIGRIGEHPAGFETCIVNDAGLKSQFGVEVQQIELESVFAEARVAEVDPAVSENLSKTLSNWDEMEPEATQGTLKVYQALREKAQHDNLAGLAVRCWPEFFTDLGCAACGAMSLLNEDQKPGGCEADVNGTITQLILQWLGDAPAFGTDIVDFDLQNDTAVLWHCGQAPLSMADPNYEPQATIHSNRKLPLLMQFPLKPGRVTLARLSEASGEFRLVVGSGEMQAAEPSFSGTSGVIRFDRPAQDVLDTIMYAGLEHHVALVYGDYVDALLMLARLLQIPVLRL